MKPRVAVVLSGFGVVERGAESMLSELLPRLTHRFELTVYSRSGQGPNGVARPALARQTLERLYLSTRPGRKLLDSLFLDPIHVEWASHLLCSLPSLARGRYDVIWHETGLWGGYILAALRRVTGVKLLDYAHSSHPGWELPFARRRPDIWVTANPELAQRVRSEVAGLRVEVVSQGVNCERFRPDVQPLELGLEGPIALVVGSLTPDKRPDLAVAAAARSGATVALTGDGPLRDRIDRLGAELLGPQRYRHLRIDGADLPRLYAAVDLLVLSSPLESGALVALEAMACGKPVVTAADSVRRRLVADAGVLVEEQSIEAYAGAISEALHSDWGQRPRSRALLYSVEKQAQRFGDLLADLAGENR